jgi:hypothetical protein
MQLFIFCIVIAPAGIIFLIRFLKQRRKRKLLTERIQRISMKREWKVVEITEELFDDVEHFFTDEGIGYIEAIISQIRYIEKESAQKINAAQSDDDKNFYWNDMNSKIHVRQHRLVYTGLEHLRETVRKDPLFQRRVFRGLLRDVKYLEARKRRGVPFSKDERSWIGHLIKVIISFSMPDVSKALLPRINAITL